MSDQRITGGTAAMLPDDDATAAEATDLLQHLILQRVRQRRNTRLRVRGAQQRRPRRIPGGARGSTSSATRRGRAATTWSPG
ncbi:MAG: hypothetical protein M5T61_04760 [Acidimicrobiia bacterium]|nr:hypothetical protein [Acidimicrobiia bacterium]